MSKSSPPRRPPLDVFDDEDLNRAQEALVAATGRESRPRAEKRSPLRLDAPIVESCDESRPQPASGTGGEGRDVESTWLDNGLDHGIVEATDAHLKFRVRQSTRARFDSFKAELSCALGGARLMDSNLGRALMDWFLEHAADSVIAAARGGPGGVRRPPSDDPVAMAAFDAALGELISDALKR